MSGQGWFGPHKDFTDQMFGLWLVLSWQGNSKWLCRCTSCGVEKRVDTGSLTSGKSKSCGKCSKPTGATSPLWRGTADMSGRVWKRITAGARHRDIAFSLTPEYVIALLHTQEYRCALSGVLISLPKRWDEDYSASLDRIDSTQGYHAGNVQWIHKDVNRMKGTLSDAALVSWCAHIAGHRGTA